MHLNSVHLQRSTKLIKAKNHNHKRIIGFHKKKTNNQVVEITMKNIVLSQMHLRTINQQQIACSTKNLTMKTSIRRDNLIHCQIDSQPMLNQFLKMRMRCLTLNKFNKTLIVINFQLYKVLQT